MLNTGPGIELVPPPTTTTTPKNNHRIDKLMKSAAQPDAFWATALPVPFQETFQSTKIPQRKAAATSVFVLVS